MNIFLYGKDSFRSQQQLKRIVTKFRADRDPEGLNVVELDCATSETPHILEQMLAAPFLADRRMVVLKRFLSAVDKSCIATVAERIGSGSLPNTTVYVFWEDTDTWKKKDAKALAAVLSKEKFAQKFDLLTGGKLQGWIMQTVEEFGGSIDRDSTHYLSEHVGNDMWRLASVLEQLCAYCLERTITKKDVVLFVEEGVDDNIFNLVDAIVGKQPKQVYAMLQKQYAIGKDPGYVFAMMLRQFRILLEMRDLFDREDVGNSAVIAKRLGLHPFVAKKSLPLVKRYSASELTETYSRLLAIDTQTKTGQADQGQMIDFFVGKLCVQRQS